MNLDLFQQSNQFIFIYKTPAMDNAVEIVVNKTPNKPT